MDDNNYQIRIYENQDHDRVMSFILSVIESEFSSISHFFSLEDVENIRSAYDGKRDQFFILSDNGNIIGTAAVKEDDQDTALLRRFFIHPRYRLKGLGNRLVSKVIHFCRQYGYKTVQFRGLKQMASAHNMLKKIGFNEQDMLDSSGAELVILTYDLGKDSN